MAASDDPFREVSPSEFLHSVREALGLESERYHPPIHPEARPTAGAMAAQIEHVRARLKARRADVVALMEKMAALSNWRLLKASGPDETRRVVKDLIQELGVSKIALTEHPILRKLSLAKRLRDSGLDILVASKDAAESLDALHRQINEAELGISGVDYALAESGSCIILPGSEVSRVVPLLPPNYLAIVSVSQIVETFEELLAFRRASFLKDGRLSSYMSIITGPSRTGDIEQTIVIGAHGPRVVYMLLVDGLDV